MKFLFIIVLCVFASFSLFAQSAEMGYGAYKNYLKTKGLPEDSFEEFLHQLSRDPDLYNGLWRNVMQQADGTRWELLRDINLRFKTFQAKNDLPSSLGMSYAFSFDYMDFSGSGRSQRVQSVGINTRGNVAFIPDHNPNDFLETHLSYSFSSVYGGTVNTPGDTSVYEHLNQLEDSLVMFADMSSDTVKRLLAQFNEHLSLSPQYYFRLHPRLGFESNQAFTRMQYVTGLSVGMGAKVWDQDSRLRWLNLPDYPFAFIRRLLGTDSRFAIYGNTIPVLRAGVSYVVPIEHAERKQITGDLTAFPRLEGEAGFKTFLGSIRDDKLFFSAAYRYYQEVSPQFSLKHSGLATHHYLVMSLETVSGFFVSYAGGKLPLDSRYDQVYSMGFNYNIN